MPRNTFIFIVLLSVFAAMTAVVNFAPRFTQSAPLLEPQDLSPTPSSTIPTLLSYENTACGISFRYPNTLTALGDTPRNAVFTNQHGEADTIMLTCQEEIPRPPLEENRTETVAIGSISATLYHDGSGRDETPIDKLIFFHPQKNLDVLIAGLGPSFQNMLETLAILP
ncbi:MAG: hypothetical protein Q7S76_04245 [bacterium]|nr:hypothetical protein [bacterium]